MIRAGCYCRISSDPKDKREGVDRQREDTTTLCEVKGWIPAGFYIDNDRSASNGKAREQWDRLLADIEAGKIDGIAVWSQDRSWRKMAEFEELRRFFDKLGRKIPFATTTFGEIDLHSPEGVLMLQMRTANSEFETAMMKVRLRRAARQKAEQGRPQWKRAFGYLGDTYQPDPVTAPLVREAYASVLAGCSLKDVCRLFNDAGAHGLNGKPWTTTAVSLFLRKPRNAGLRAHNGEIIDKGTWPALVDETMWRATQSVLNAPGRMPGRKSVRRHLLTSMLRCGREGCGGTLRGNWVVTSTGQRSITYSCKQCRRVSIRAEHIEPLVYAIIGSRLAQDEARDLLKAKLDQAEAETINRQLMELHTEIANIGVERGQQLLTGVQAKAATDIIEAKIKVLKDRQEDQELLQVFADIPIGTPEAINAVAELTPDRFRAVIDKIVTLTVLPVGNRGPVFTPERLQVDWRR